MKNKYYQMQQSNNYHFFYRKQYTNVCEHNSIYEHKINEHNWLNTLFV